MPLCFALLTVQAEEYSDVFFGLGQGYLGIPDGDEEADDEEQADVPAEDVTC